MDPFRMESLSTPEEEESESETRVDAVRAVVVWHVVGVCGSGEAAQSRASP